MREVRIFNSHDIAELGPDKLYLHWSPQVSGRYYRPAYYAVIRIGFKTDPRAHWQQDGHKWFCTYEYEYNRERTVEAAMVWADQSYGRREWVRDPNGSYQDARALEAVRLRIKDHRKSASKEG
jgi:hypothetical protein